MRQYFCLKGTDDPLCGITSITQDRRPGTTLDIEAYRAGWEKSPNNTTLIGCLPTEAELIAQSRHPAAVLLDALPTTVPTAEHVPPTA